VEAFSFESWKTLGKAYFFTYVEYPYYKGKSNQGRGEKRHTVHILGRKGERKKPRWLLVGEKRKNQVWGGKKTNFTLRAGTLLFPLKRTTVTLLRVHLEEEVVLQEREEGGRKRGFSQGKRMNSSRRIEKKEKGEKKESRIPPPVYGGEGSVGHVFLHRMGGKDGGGLAGEKREKASLYLTSPGGRENRHILCHYLGTGGEE